VFRAISWALVLCVTACWAICVVISRNGPNGWLNLPLQYEFGAASYIVGVVLSEIKEVL